MKFCNGINYIIALLKPLLIIHTVIILTVFTLALILGEAALSPYIKEISSHILSVREIALFTSSLATAAFLLEYILRHHIQEKLLNSSLKHSSVLAFSIPILLTTLLHSPFGIAGIIY